VTTRGSSPKVGSKREKAVEDRLAAEVHENFGPAAAGCGKTGAEARDEDNDLYSGWTLATLALSGKLLMP
jgi:hypothetical protein